MAAPVIIDTEPSVIILRCPWDSPPLRSNQRLHWAAKAKLTKRVRSEAAGCVYLQTSARALLGRVIVTMVWEVTDKRRRDVGAMAPTLKAFIDGMVDGGLLRADSHDVVAEERLRIEVGQRVGVRVEIEAA
jgi:Holliday junction resolvase RusA-like endonuclease